jgi:lipoate-protein ligase A
VASVKNAGSKPGPLLWAETFHSPAENLACDEALLDECESSDVPGFVRFWESSSYFVVLGYGKHLEREVFGEVCAEKNIPILRRCSGGGTVVQGPGCFNYTLVLPIASAPELETISGANCSIMRRIRDGVSAITDAAIEVKGFTDLVVNGRKFSGNSQRRKRRCLLFHGAFLLNFDLEMITRTLRLPAQQPEYRAGRAHAEFLTNLPVERSKLEEAIRTEWNVKSGFKNGKVFAATAELVRTKYSQSEWNKRF